MTTKLNLVITPEMYTLVEEYQQLNGEKGFDARTKLYKDAKSRMEDIQNEVNKILESQTREYLKENDIPLEHKPDLKIGINSYVFMDYRDLRPRASLNCKQFRYNNDSIDLEEKSIEEVKEWIDKGVEEYRLKCSEEAQRVEVANKLLQEVEADVTYKNYSWKYDEKESDKWEGSELQSEYEFEGEKYSDESAKIEMNIRKKDEINCEFRIRTKFKSVEEAKKFWDEAKRFIESQETKFVKVKRN